MPVKSVHREVGGGFGSRLRCRIDGKVSCRVTLAWNCCMVNGLAINSAAPVIKAWARIWLSWNPLMKITGICRRRRSALIWRQTSKPLMPGRRTSSRMRSNHFSARRRKGGFAGGHNGGVESSLLQGAMQEFPHVQIILHKQDAAGRFRVWHGDGAGGWRGSGHSTGHME